MNDGSRRRVMRVPWMAPNTAQNASPARIAAHHGQRVVTGCTSCTVMAAPQAPTNPTDRSISPRTSANPSPMARTITTALCWNRLTRLTGDRKTWLGLQIVNTTRIATMAAMTGSTPLSPDRMRDDHARTYSPSDCATSAGGTSFSATSGAAVRSTAAAGSALFGSATAAARSSCRHVLDDRLPVELRGILLDDKASQVHHGDSVSHLEYVVQVVGDDHHRQSSVAQALDQVEHLPRLDHAQGRGGLVHDHQLRVPHHGLGDGHRLALST